MNGIIYMRTSPSGKRYIGQTTQAEEARWKQHVYNATHKNSTEWKTPLSASIRKYGGDSFTVEILENGIVSPEKLNEREIYWIKEKHTLASEKKNGLNVTIGGYGYRKFVNEDFQGLYDEGLSIGEIAKITGANPSTVSDHLETDSKENYSRSRRNALKKNPPRSISNYDTETCEKIMTFSSSAEASLYYCGIRDSAYVTGCIYGRTASCLGYFWKYDDQPMDVVYEQYKRYHNPNNHNTRGLSVVNVETGETYKSALSAAKETGIGRDLIVSCYIGMRENAGGFHWRYEDKEQAVYRGTHAKPIVCIETGEIYPSVSEAARQTKIPINKITDCIKGRRENANGFRWEYKNPADKESGEFKNTCFKPVLCVDTGVVYETMKAAAKAAGVGEYKLRNMLKSELAFINGCRWKYAESQE